MRTICTVAPNTGKRSMEERHLKEDHPPGNKGKRTRIKSFIIASACLAILLLFLVGRLFLLPDKYLRQIYLVPEDAIFILETGDPVGSWKTFSTSDMWQFMKTFPPFAEIAASASPPDSVLRDTRRLLNLAGSRNCKIYSHILPQGD